VKSTGAGGWPPGIVRAMTEVAAAGGGAARALSGPPFDLRLW
jgi:hypothetical protein